MRLVKQGCVHTYAKCIKCLLSTILLICMTSLLRFLKDHDHLLAMKARAMPIGVNLPTYLWPWIIQASGCVMNRTPMRKHDWKTPFKKVIYSKPHLGHLQKYGCKAYALDKHLPQKEKLMEKDHIGFLLGYDSTNIFLIWVLVKEK